MIPSRALVLLAVVPLALAALTLVDRTVLWPMLAADAAIALVAALDAALARRPLVSVRRKAPRVLSIGRPSPVTLELRSTARRALTVAVRDDLFEAAEAPELPLAAELPARGRAELRYHVQPNRRGAFALGDHHVRYPSPLGLWTRQIRVEARSPVRVYPDVQAVRAYELLARQEREQSMFRASRRRGGESEFERLREYRRGDEYRSIDWKGTARRQKLISREYQLESNQSIMLLLDAGRLMTAETGSLSLFDHALNATLMLAHVAARGGDHVGLLAFADGVRCFAPPAGGPRAAHRIVQAGYDLHPELVETSYAEAFGALSMRVRKRTLVVIFTQVVDDVAAGELLRQTRGLLPRHLPLCVLFRDSDVDGLLEPARERGGGASDAELYVKGAAAELMGHRDRLIRDLKRHGALVLDVGTSELTPGLINRYLEIKARHLL
ncbi:hypothetical protein SOCE26_044790 [Sorangium cellulosum]|uniref:DUF58 domain-containing protein n=1 Tax=Sorangium cellulosum TaxID=56 RepID=A0A2L0EUU3_SORCE|nr:DUF58 domain-containing protein [Sorangium cellulosum]AUX43039.1 hypothetical protein SOCE26_044790 [Sorangium cellulosum]